MTFNFCRKVFSIGSGDVQSPLQFYKKGFELTSNGTSPSWRDIILSGNTALTLANAKADGLNYVKLFGGTEQNGTPTPTTPMNIVCNNGVVKYGAIGKNLYNSTTRTDGYYIGENGTIAQSSGTFCYSALIPVKPNTAYVLSGIAGQSDIRRFHAYDSNGNWISQISFASTNVGRIYNITGTTPNNCVYVRISIPMADRNVQIEQGSTATAYEPYQAGIYTDGTVETVEITGKNLLDKSIFAGDINDTITYTSYQVPNGTYTMSTPDYPWTLSVTNVFFLAGNVSTGASSSLNGVAINKPITITVTDGYYTVGHRYTSGSNLNNTHPIDYNWQIEQGSTATTYEPYYNGGSATAEMLLKVGNYQDEQEIISGVVTRKVGVKVLDGTEGWTNPFNNGRYVLPFQKVIRYGLGANNKLYCSHFKPSIEAASNLIQGCGFYINTGAENVPQLRITYPDMPMLSDFKSWLADQYNAGTPVTIVYPLATPTTESVTAQPLSIQAGTNIITAEGSIENLELEVSYKATV